jgi:hypothetical protein
MDQTKARFEQYLKRRFGQSSTPKHYLSDIHIFIRTVSIETPLDFGMLCSEFGGQPLSRRAQYQQLVNHGRLCLGVF